MGPILTALVRLQGIEDELRRVKKKLNMGRQAIVKQENLIRQSQAAWAAKREEVKLTRVQAGNLELELKVKDQEIDKLRVALNAAKSNKDYSAILTQLNVDKADKSKLEDKILGLMSQADADAKAAEEIEEEIAAEQAKLEEITAKIEAKQENLNHQAEKLERDRAEALKDVPAQNRDAFTRLADRYDGEALAEVAELNAKRGEYGCGGCFMSIPRELVNSLMTRDEVVVCSTCGRMLVLELPSKATV